MALKVKKVKATSNRAKQLEASLAASAVPAPVLAVAAGKRNLDTKRDKLRRDTASSTVRVISSV